MQLSAAGRCFREFEGDLGKGCDDRLLILRALSLFDAERKKKPVSFPVRSSRGWKLGSLQPLSRGKSILRNAFPTRGKA